MMDQQENDTLMDLMKSIIALPQHYETQVLERSVTFEHLPRQEDGEVPFRVHKAFLLSDLSLTSRLHFVRLLLGAIASLPSTSHRFEFKVDASTPNYAIHLFSEHSIVAACFVKHPLTGHGIELAINLMDDLHSPLDDIHPSH